MLLVAGELKHDLRGERTGQDREEPDDSTRSPTAPRARRRERGGPEAEPRVDIAARLRRHEVQDGHGAHEEGDAPPMIHETSSVRPAVSVALIASLTLRRRREADQQRQMRVQVDLPGGRMSV